SVSRSISARACADVKYLANLVLVACSRTSVSSFSLRISSTALENRWSLSATMEPPISRLTYTLQSTTTRSGFTAVTGCHAFPHLLRDLQDLRLAHRLLGPDLIEEFSEPLACQLLVELLRQLLLLLRSQLGYQFRHLLVGEADAGAFGEGHGERC